MKSNRVRFHICCVMLIVGVACFLLLTGCSTSSQSTTSELSPLEKALASGKPTLAEFGRGTCVPCKAMKPILEELSTEYQDKLNVVIVSVDDYRILTRRYKILAIPTQIFFDSSGIEITRHVGFYAKDDIVAQLKEMGIE